MKIHNLSIEQSLISLKSSIDGLSARESKRRLTEFGLNVIEEIQREPLLLRFLREFTHFFAIILWIAAALAFTAEHFDPGQGMASLGIAVIVVIFINGIFSFWQEYRAEQAISELRQFLPQKTRVVRNGIPLELLATQIVPGDLIMLNEGDFIPADCRLLEAFALRVNTATITGESLPVARSSEISGEESPLYAKNVLLAGTFVVSGHARAVVYATGMRTEFGRIAQLTQTTGAVSSPLQREIARLSHIVAIIASSIGIVFFFVGQSMGLPIVGNMLFCIGIIVANVPEGLLPTVTLSLAMATQRMAKRHALVRHLPAVEALGSTTTICCDKTGTLTLNRMSVERLWFADQLYTVDETLTKSQLLQNHHDLFFNTALCHNLKQTIEKHSTALVGDPMEIALVNMGQKMIGETAAYHRLGEVAFDTDRKRMSVLYQKEDQRLLYCKGAPETVIPICRYLQLDSEVVALDSAALARIQSAQQTMTDAGLRVLAFAHGVASNGTEKDEHNLILSGLVGLKDPPRAEVPAAIARCLGAGIRIIMVTGDHPHTALAIARQIGLIQSDHPVIIHGDELKSISTTQLQLLLDAKEIIFARVAAEQKMLIVQALQKKGEIVAVTGDGVNDAPALKVADIGIAMGITGTDVAKSAADVILLDDNFASIVASIEEGRAVYENIRKFLTYILSSNIPELIPYLAFVLFKIPLPLTVMQILAIDLGTDILPAIALGAERPDHSVMLRPPRSIDERLLSWRLLARAYLFLGVLEAIAAMTIFLFVLKTSGWQYGTMLNVADPLYLKATSSCLATIVVMQMMNVFLCRHTFKSTLSIRALDNPYILLGLFAELVIILFILYTALGNWLFGTTPINLTSWFLALGCALIMLGLEELRKWWLRRFYLMKQPSSTHY